MTAPTAHLHVHEQLCHALHAACSAITRSYRPRLAAIGLTYPQYLVMMVLWDHGERTIGQIATALAQPSHAVTPIVQRLETDGLICRRPDECDRRISWIAPTQAGRAAEQGAVRAQSAVGLDTGFTDADLSQLRDTLRRLTAALTMAADDDPTDRTPDSA